MESREIKVQIKYEYPLFSQYYWKTSVSVFERSASGSKEHGYYHSSNYQSDSYKSFYADVVDDDPLEA